MGDKKLYRSKLAGRKANWLEIRPTGSKSPPTKRCPASSPFWKRSDPATQRQ